MTFDISDASVREVLEKVARFLESLEAFDSGRSYGAQVELPKTEIADALLRALHLPRRPPDAYEARESPKSRTVRIRRVVRARVYRRDNFRCQGCGVETDLTIDHRIPVAKGGTDDEDNLQTLCRSCNSGKGDRA